MCFAKIAFIRRKEAVVNSIALNLLVVSHDKWATHRNRVKRNICVDIRRT